jgi:hypothetical protein
MTSESGEIAAQLFNIKKWIVVGAISFLMIGLSAVVFTASIVNVTISFDNTYSSEGHYSNPPVFSNEMISELINRGKLNDALVLIINRLQTHPNDPYAHWYKSRIHVLKKEWGLAQQHVEKMEILAPSWKRKYIAPLRKKIKDQIKLGEFDPIGRVRNEK